MRTLKSISLLAVTVALALCMGRGEAQVTGTVPIGGSLQPGQPVDPSFGNIFDLTHPKLLTLSAIALTGVTPDFTTFLDVQFDWLDVGGTTQLSPVTTIPVPGGIPTPVELTFTVPFCPEEVSFHLLEQPVGEGPRRVPVSVTWPMQIDGFFVHECLVPEADALIPAGLLLTGMTVWGWRRRARKAS